jgi:hypothetical protein
MAIEVGRQYRLEYASVLAAAVTVTAISKASEAVVTASNTYANGDYVLFGQVDGMQELSYMVAKVKAVSGTNFTLEGVDSTNFGTWVAGGCQKVTTWGTIALATSVDFGSGSVDALDVTVLLDSTKQSQAGLIAQSDITVNLFSDYSASAQTAIDAAAYAATILAFRTTKSPSTNKRVWSGIPSTIGESVNVNQPITGSFTIINRSQRANKYLT